jgi:hypothetical protein
VIANFPVQLVDLVLLLEADEFLALGRVLCVVGHDIHLLASLLAPAYPPLETSASAN